MVTDNVPGPARVVLMKNSDWMPGREEEEMHVDGLEGQSGGVVWQVSLGK